jgi:tRNA(Ile)-lysidine synthase
LKWFLMNDTFRTAIETALPDKTRRVAVAVSGGGDSMALALLLLDAGYDISVLTVDHGLRPESASEAQAVAAFFAARGVAHRVLHWTGDKPDNGIQEHARQARYALMIAACRDMGIDTLAVAHNAEDQIETFWMRLAHGSGLDGLSGMARSRVVDGVRIVRPLMSFTRAELRAVCDAAAVPYADDPSNANEKFLRVRLRGFEQVLADEGLTPDRLARTMEKLQDARDALDWMTDDALPRVAEVGDGTVMLHRDAWVRYPADIRRRLLVAVMRQVLPQDYPPGDLALRRLDAALTSPGFSGHTLGGCQFAPAGDTVRVTPEPERFQG